MYDRPFVDSMNVHDVTHVEVRRHTEARCWVIVLTGTDGEFSRFTINVWRGHDGQLPELAVEGMAMDVSR